MNVASAGNPPAVATRKKGRPVLGAISGFVLGLGIAVLLQQYAIMPLTVVTMLGLPIVLLAFGLILGLAPRGPRIALPQKVCHTCGVPLAPKAAFCAACGTRQEVA